MRRVPNGFGEIGGELAVAGRPVSDWTTEAGDTPFFLYDRALIARRLAELRAALPAEVGIHYAIKANPMPALVAWIAPFVDGLDVASAGELRVALAATKAGRISFAGPGKRDFELSEAIAAGATLNVESEGELERAAAIGQRLGKRVRAALRINPPFDLKGSGMRMGGGAKPFGIDADLAPGLLGRLGELNIDFDGFHIFSGSQNLSAEALIETQALTVALAGELAADAPSPPRTVNIGGGFGIPYFPGDEPLDAARVGAALRDVLDARPDTLRDSEFVVELGRYIVGEAGIYVTRVIDRKVSRGETFLVCDGGLHHQLAASGNFGTVIRRNYPLVNASRMGETNAMTANVVGCLCTPLDKLGDKVVLPETRVGDLVAVFMAGAYGLTASPTAFLGHAPPGEILA